MAIDARNLYPMPDSMTYEEGALLEPLSVGIWGCKRAGLAGGDDVLVTGAGPVGLLAAASARALGAGSVTVTDLSDFRLELARGMASRPSALTNRATIVSTCCSSAPVRPVFSARRWLGSGLPDGPR